MITLAQYERIAARHNAVVQAETPADTELAEAIMTSAVEVIHDGEDRLRCVELHQAALRSHGTTGEAATRAEFYAHLSGLIPQH